MRTNRPYVQIDPDVLERVHQIDLLSYLREFEPSNLVTIISAVGINRNEGIIVITRHLLEKQTLNHL
jgi:hypothetical protein